mmetsp:Transcript_12083/g.35262  ORF Transcript_12083/g.35262 Transcript_12083/m.35262 type:complete len:160 (-) Transcript_12083:59-538(-)
MLFLLLLPVRERVCVAASKAGSSAAAAAADADGPLKRRRKRKRRRRRRKRCKETPYAPPRAPRQIVFGGERERELKFVGCAFYRADAMRPPASGGGALSDDTFRARARASERAARSRLFRPTTTRAAEHVRGGSTARRAAESSMDHEKHELCSLPVVAE